MGKFLSSFNQKLLVTDKKNYHREQLQTYMTSPEWRNVEMAEEFAKYIKSGRSLFSFPYFQQVMDLWKIVGKSYRSANKYDSHAKIWFGTDYMAMDLFVPFFTSLELIPKGIVSLFLRPFLNKENKTSMQEYLGNYFERYATKLHTVPFYDHPYEEELENLRKAFQDCKDKTMTDRLSYYFILFDLWSRKWISKPLHAWFHDESNLVAATTDILVKYNANDISDPDMAKQEFLAKLQNAQAIANAEIVNDEVFVKNKNPQKSYTSIYARLRGPRYDDFKDTTKALNEQGIAIKKIAGNDNVQVKCVVETDTKEHLENIEKTLQSIQPAKLLYSYGDRIKTAKNTLLFDVPVKDLQPTLDKLQKCEDTTIKFIHNF